MKTIAIFCSSSEVLAPEYYETAKNVGSLLGKYGYSLVYGGSDLGLMKTVSGAARQAGAHCTGVIPQLLADRGLACNKVDKQIITPGMHERKKMIEDLADAFVTLPGGFGTYEELLEVITLKQLGYHKKPIIILNTLGFYNNLLAQFDETYKQHFAKTFNTKVYEVCTTEEQIFEYINAYIVEQIPDKWY